MLRALVYRDLMLLKRQTKDLLWTPVMIGGLVALARYAGDAWTAGFLGEEFLQAAMLLLVAIGVCMPYYGAFLAADRRDGVDALAMMGRETKGRYCAAKAVVPLSLGLVASALTALLFALVVGGAGVSLAGVGIVLLVMVAEMVLMLAVGLLLSLLIHVDLRQNPGVLLSAALVNVPLLVWINPLTSPAMFAAVTLIAAAVLYGVSLALLRRRFRGNARPAARR